MTTSMIFAFAAGAVLGATVRYTIDRRDMQYLASNLRSDLMAQIHNLQWQINELKK